MIALPSLFSAVVSLALALFVLSRDPKGLPHRAFGLGLLSLFVLELGNFLALGSASPPEVLFWKRVSLIGEVFLPAHGLLFSLVFGRSSHQESRTRWKPILAGVYLLSFVFLAFIPSDRFLDGSSLASAAFGLEVIFLGEIGRLFYPFLLLGSVLILANLENTLRSAVEPRRSQVKWMLLGVGGLFGFFIYLTSQTLLYSRLSLEYLPLGSLVYLVCLGVVIFSLARHGFLPVDVFVSRQVLYHSWTFLLAGGYLLAVGLLTQALRYLGGGWAPHLGVLLTFLSSMGLVTLLLSARHQSRVKAFIGAHFYRSKYDYRSLWQKTTARLGSSLAVEEVLSLAEGLLVETLGPKGIAFWLYDDHRKGFYPAHPRNAFGGRKTSLDEEDELVRLLFGLGRPATFKELSGSTPSPSTGEGRGGGDHKLAADRSFIDANNNLEPALWVPLIAGERKVGLMTLWGGLSENGFDREDRELLKTLSVPIAHHLLTARLSADLVAAKQIEAFSHLATFVLHDLKNFTSSLSLVVQNAGPHWNDPDFRNDALEAVSNTVARMKDLTDRLSVPAKAGLQRRATDLNALISKTLEQLNGHAGRISFFPGHQPLPRVDLDSGEIQRVLLNLLLNARDAISEHGEITVRTEARNGWVAFSVTDDGCGMSEEFLDRSLFVPFRSTKDRGTGIGLYQCKNVVEAHQGRIEVESRPGRGTTFTVKLPASPDK